MSEITIARRYAQALNEQAAQSGAMGQIDADVAMISEGLSASRELQNFFSSPIISREKKAEVIKGLFQESAHDVTMRFLVMMVEKRRENLFPVVAASYQELRDQQLGVTPVSVRTSHSLSDEDQVALVATLEKLTGNKVRLDSRIDSSILGGIVIRVGDTVYDGSVVNQLATLRERLESGMTS